MRLLNQIRADRAGSRRGGVLVLSLVAVAVVASLSVGFLQLSAMVTRRQVGASDTKLAFYLAEAGLAESYSGIMVGHTGAIGAEDQPAVMGDGLVWVEATSLDADHVQLVANGMARSGRAKLAMVVRRGHANVGGLGIFSEDDVSVGDGTLIDGYDSTQGSYDDQAAADPASVKLGKLGSNGNVTVSASLLAPTSINGDVSAGPAGVIETLGLPTITGSTETSLSLVDLDAVTPPDTTMYAGITWPAGTPLVVPAGTFGGDYLHLEPDSEVVLQGPLTLVLDGLTAAAGAEITFDTTGGEIELYVANELTLDPASVLTETDPDATQVTVKVAGPASVDLGSAGPFHGLFYAPEATVNVGADFELFGGLIGQQLVLADGAALHYDRALIADGAQDALPRVLSWQILELPETTRDTVNVDPFVVLGVDPTTCPTLSRAHQDQTLAITYLDSGAVQQTYNGPESGFDWGLVRTVLELKRTGGLVTDDVRTLSLSGALGVL